MLPVPERPPLPQTVPPTPDGVLAWSSMLLKQLIYIFQEFGLRINNCLPKDGSELMRGTVSVTVPVGTDGVTVRDTATNDIVAKIRIHPSGWGRVIAEDLNDNVMASLEGNPVATGPTVTSAGAVQLGTFTVATLPSAATFVRCILWVSDEVGGAQPAYSDGTNWRRFSDGAIAS